MTRTSPAATALRTSAFCLALLNLLLVADSARAAKIVYSCAPQLCAVEPATGISATITRDGASSAYGNPSVSRSGDLVAASRGADVVVGPFGANLTEAWASSRSINDVAIAPDGKAVAESHSYVENRYGCPLTGGCLELVDRSGAAYATGPEAPAASFLGGGGVGFLGAGLLSSFYKIGEDLHYICVAATPAAPGAGCEPRVSSSAALSSPDGSPDGKLIAVTVTGADDKSAVELFDATSGRPVRRLASGYSPAFSPDGRQVAYAGEDGWIHVVPTGGGRSQRVVKGTFPSWGGGEGPGPSLASRTLRVRNGGVAVAISCGLGKRCRGAVKLRKGRIPLGSGQFRIAPRKRKTVRVALTAKGASTLAGANSHRVTVLVAPSGGKPARAKLALRG